MTSVSVPHSYAPPAGRYDELVDADGAIRPHWRPLLNAWSTIGADEIVRRRGVAERLLVAEGAGHVFHDEHQIGMSWGLDPVPYVIGGQEWAGIERGMAQRVRVLNAVIEDLYGQRRLLVDGVLPVSALLASRAYQMGAIGAAVHGPRLTHAAADLVRDHRGRWLVLRDHTDAPAGCGYALMNRTVLSRLYPEPYRQLGVRPLAGWFAELRDALAEAAPPSVDSPRTVVLGPEPQRVGFVEASYLAAHLGYHLAGSGDLTTRQGQLWLRTLGGLERIDVLFRRVADAGADPLEFGPALANGVTGLQQAVRAGGVGVANSLGSGVADRLWLQPFLAAAAEHLLGESLQMPSVETWWCGDPERLAAVHADPEGFVLHDIDSVTPSPSVFIDDLSDQEMQQWLAQLAAEPYRFVAQPKLDFAGTPVAVDGELRSGTASIRVQMVARGERVAVLPGGHGRHVSAGRLVVNAADASGKDVWVLHDSDHARAAASVSVGGVRPPLPQIDLRNSLPTRTAEALFWLGRNAERAEAAARVSRLVISRSNGDAALVESRWLDGAIAALRSASGGAAGAHTDGSSAQQPLARLQKEITSTLVGRSGAVADSLGHLAANAGGARGYLSNSTWRIVNQLDGERVALAALAAGDDSFSVTECLDRIVVDLAALSGLVTESMVRGPGWRFLDLGRRLERAVLLLGLIEATLSEVPDGDVLQPLCELVLGSSESLVAYRRRYRSDFRIAAIQDLLAYDDTNPRSLAFQLDRVNEHLVALPWNSDTAAHQRLLEQTSRVMLGEPPESPAKLVLDLRGPLLDLISGLMTSWFTHPARRRLGTGG
jgi:uncharacterized circularly permuted ATP-grasp superfamily protein/uncharacterized alpha-E superfamily protein